MGVVFSAYDLLLDAAADPALRDAALARLVAHHLDLGQLDEAAAVNAQRLTGASLAAGTRPPTRTSCMSSPSDPRSPLARRQ